LQILRKTSLLYSHSMHVRKYNPEGLYFLFPQHKRKQYPSGYFFLCGGRGTRSGINFYEIFHDPDLATTSLWSVGFAAYVFRIPLSRARKQKETLSCFFLARGPLGLSTQCCKQHKGIFGLIQERH